jgi:uncharacterized protein (TIGR03083 family)
MTRDVFLEGLAAFVRFARRDDVAERWDEPSVLAGYRVGGLIGHVFSGSSSVERYLDQDPPLTASPDPGTSYFAGVPDTATAERLHADIRERGHRLADHGPGNLSEQFEALVDRLAIRLAREPVDRLVKPFGSGVLRLDDYLETRVVELVVHHDDVAASIGLDPDIPPDCLELAVVHLIGVARHRHGDLAILRALARRERDATGALRVF